MSTKVKICGITTPEALNTAIRSGARFIGLVFYPKSPRNISFNTAHHLAKSVPTGVRTVALFVDPDDALLERVLGGIQIDMVQLHGNESPARVQEIKDKYHVQTIKAFRIANESDLSQVESYSAAADWFLFDAKPKNATLPGGTGQSFDWAILKDRTWSKPWMLSGGLNPDNVTDALTLLHPDAVDVSSGVESAPGQKDLKRITKFIRQAKREAISND